MLEDYQKSHEFRAPCCLCASLDGAEYTESAIGIVEEAHPGSGENGSFMNGQYVALCSARRCGYIREWYIGYLNPSLDAHHFDPSLP